MADTSEHLKSHDQHALDPQNEHAMLLFREVWAELEKEVGRSRLRFPKEIIWLNGAPGSGKGTNTPFILRERSITAPPLVISDLLNTPEFKRIKDAGNLVGDRDVVAALLRRLLDQVYQNGLVVDGFPRTKPQVECLKIFNKKMLELRKEFAGTPDAEYFPKPIFRIAVLFVEEREAVERQLKRGREIISHNQRVRETGVGDLREERSTDLSEEAAKKRYKIFREQALEALQGLKKHYHYHLINAQGSLAAVEANIIREFQYQSSLELEEETLDAVNHIPLASDITANARQNLVRRLEGYQREQTLLFKQVIWVLEHEFVPVLTIHAIGGRCDLVTENPLFGQKVAMEMLIDIVSERGYYAWAIVETKDIPARVDLSTGEITCRKKPLYKFQFRWSGSTIRRGN